MQAAMKTSATEFFTGLSPLKGGSGVSGMNGSYLANGRSGRCHCCPYGYHIDLDFVRYCEMLNQVSKNDNPTLRHLKNLKRARRRQTQSMEVLLGLEPGTEGGGEGGKTGSTTTTTTHHHHHTTTSSTPSPSSSSTSTNTVNYNSLQQFPRLQIIEEPSKTDFKTRPQGREKTPPPPPPPRRCRPLGGSGGAGGPPPDVINTSRRAVHDALAAMNNSNNRKTEAAGGGGGGGGGGGKGHSSSLDPSVALQEAVLDFEEMLETSRERIGVSGSGGGGGGGRSSTLPSLDLLHHTPQQPSPLHHHHHLKTSGVGVSRSHSLPRQWLRRPLYPSLSSPCPSPTPSRTHSDTEDSSRMAVVRALRLGGGGGGWGRPVSTPPLPHHHYYHHYHHHFLPISSSTPPPPPTPAASGEDWPAVSRLRTSSTSSLPPPPDVGHIQQGGDGRLADTLAALNAARGCCTPSHQDFDTLSLASGVSGVSTTTLQSIRDQMATSLARLKELEEEVKAIPVLQIKVNVLKEEKRLLLEQVKALSRGEERPPLMLPPSLEADLTDLSEDELEGRLASLRGVPTRRRRSESPLRVNLEEFRSYRRARRGSLSEGSEAESVTGDDYPLRITEPQDSPRRPAPPRRFGQESAYSLPATPLLGRRKARDAATSCRVLTRDVGVTHVGARTRSVGLMTSSEPTACQECEERRRKTFQHKGVVTVPLEDARRRLSQSSVSTESIGPEEAEQEGGSGGSPSKNSFLAKLGRKSAIISRLSEPQLVPPTLTFDNSTNTEPVLRRDQGCSTSLAAAHLYTAAELAKHVARAKEEWQTAERAKDQLARSSRPLTLDRGIQAALDLAAPAKTTFRPLMQSVASQAQPRGVDVGVGTARITPDPCPRCSTIRTKSVACGPSAAPAAPSPVKTRSVASGEHTLHDPCCPDRPAPPRRSVGCSMDRLTDRVCDRCDNLRVRSLGVGTLPLPTPAPPPLAEPPRPKPPLTHTAHTQTRPPATRTAAVNTTAPLPLRKEEAAPPSPAGTPEVERRAFGSSGVRVCDKCHEAITSVAKDIVGTSGGSSLPPLPPPPVSKIPRLVDITKVEPRLDPPRPDSRASDGGRADTPEPRPAPAPAPPPRTRLTPPRMIRSEALHSPSHGATASAVATTTTTKVATTTAATATVTTTTVTEAVKAAPPSPKLQGTRLGQAPADPAIKDATPPAKDATPAAKDATPAAKDATPAAASTPQDTATQAKRATYSRQNTYTKTSEGVVNLGFEDHKGAGHKQAGHGGASTSGGPALPSITEGITGKSTASTTTTTSKTHKQKTETKEDSASRKTSSESEAPVIKGSEPSVSSSSESESEDEGGSVVGGASLSLLSQLGGASTSSVFTTASEVSRKKAVPSREMKAALKVLNDSIGKPVRSGQQLTNALNIIQREWLKVSSQKDADPHAVEDYMDAFEEFSKNLLQRVVNLADVNGNTAMHYAVSHGNFDVVSVLLDSKVCNVNQQNKAGYTATMLVSLAQIRSQTHASVVQRLFQLGDLNIKASQHGQTALMLAVSHGRLDMVQLLVAAGAEVNIQDEDGSTALMCAAEHGHLAIVKFLLAQPDTDPTLMDNDGSTALAIAVEAGHRDVGVLLYKHLNLSRGSSPYSSVRIKRSRTPNTLSRSSVTPPPRSSAPSSPGRSRKSSNPASPGRSRKSSASLSNLIL
ncbi:uncharacterized protein LOC126996022 isoform X2 [Eriocheir sinensis]|uniref:uncharacterized protein LOC126996022 isoform X2 n=1 Tax=Eriocheir sinensis TaxID=95602 RepID=UPI0021CA147E|nr:uncharacterized protein LOC126996022 isoform X2 [Eriocheir sinensis]